MQGKWWQASGLFLCLLCLSGCANTAPPSKPNDVCAIFQEKPEWYWTALETQKKQHVPVSVQMAIIHQESRFRAYARPDRQWLLGIIPWFRPSTAFGYAQVLDSTWDDYLAKSGHVGSRNDFDSATTFIGWYAQQAQKRAKVPKNDAYKLYLAYHEGIGGYSKKTYLGKPWLISVAKKVKRQANRYSGQLRRCANRIPQRHWWSFW